MDFSIEPSGDGTHTGQCYSSWHLHSTLYCTTSLYSLCVGCCERNKVNVVGRITVKTFVFTTLDSITLHSCEVCCVSLCLCVHTCIFLIPVHGLACNTYRIASSLSCLVVSYIQLYIVHIMMYSLLASCHCIRAYIAINCAWFTLMDGR